MANKVCVSGLQRKWLKRIMARLTAHVSRANHKREAINVKRSVTNFRERSELEYATDL